MEESSAAQSLIFLKRYGLVIGLLLLGAVCFFYGLSQFSSHSSSDDVTFQSVTSGAPISVQPSQAGEIMVDIEGAILHPGVYTLRLDARLQELVTKAGGFIKNADHEKIAKGLNLAEKLTDGAKVYIPFVGEESLASVGQQTVLGVSTQSGGLIHINSASAEQLDTLPGVGAVTATKIISNRPYAALEDLVAKKVMGQATFDKLKEKIAL